MKIVIMAAGSLGDVAPYTGLGARLRDAGHEVTLATYESFAPLARESGLAFSRLSADRYGAASALSSSSPGGLRAALSLTRRLAQPGVLNDLGQFLQRELA